MTAGPLQGVENPPGSGLYPEPTWLGVIANDMMLWDHGCCPGGPTQIPGADVDIEYQASSSQAAASLALANAIFDANVSYATDYPAEVGDDMGATDFDGVRGRRRIGEHAREPAPTPRSATVPIRTGTRDSDVYGTYSDLDFLLGFNAVQMNVGALADLAGATMAAAGSAATVPWTPARTATTATPTPATAARPPVSTSRPRPCAARRPASATQRTTATARAACDGGCEAHERVPGLGGRLRRGRGLRRRGGQLSGRRRRAGDDGVPCVGGGLRRGGQLRRRGAAARRTRSSRASAAPRRASATWPRCATASATAVRRTPSSR